MNRSNGTNICVSTPDGKFTPLNLGQTLCQSLADLGYSPFTAEDGSPAALDADVLLLVGEGRCFDGYAKLLGNRDVRPLTVLWLIDPLPPPTISKHGLEIGFKLAKCNWRRISSPSMKTFVSCLPFHHQLQKSARWMLNRKIKKDAAVNNCLKYADIGTNQSFVLMSCLEWSKRNFEQGWIDYVFTSTVQRKQTLETVGIDAKLVPIGYHLSWGRKLALERDIDVLFLGDLKSKRRRSILQDVEKKLSARGAKLVKIHSGCYGEQRTTLLNRAKIVLNIPRIPWEIAGIRFLMSISCGALVVSEYVKDTAPYKPGVHFVQAESTQLPDVISYYLEHNDERQAIADSAYKFVTQELTLKNSMLQILESCCANTAVQTGNI